MRDLSFLLIKYVDGVKTEIDINENVIDFDIDSLSLVDESTLMYKERKANLSLTGIYNEINSIKEFIEEKTILQSTNISNQIEYDLSYDGETISDRPIMFVSPIHYQHISGNNNYNKIVFPASYNPDYHHVALCPGRYYHEEEYNSYDNEYVIDKPFFYNFFLEVKQGDIVIYFGVCEIDGYLYNPKEDTLSMSFTDGNGVIIKCLDKLKNIQTYYQNVPFSGIMMNDLAAIIPKIVQRMYPDIYDRLVFNNNINYFKDRLGLRLSYNAGLETNPDNTYLSYPTKYRCNIFDENTNQMIMEILVNGDSRDYAYIEYNNYQYFQHTLSFLTKMESNMLIVKFHELFEYQGSFRLLETTINILINFVDGHISYDYSHEYMMFDEYNITYPFYIQELESDGFSVVYENPNWFSQSSISGSLYMLLRKMFSFNTYIVNQDDNTGSDIEEIVALCNDEGFNTNPDTIVAFKIYLMSRCKSIMTLGNEITFPSFAYGNNTIEINDEYIEDIAISEMPYDKPSLDVINNITNYREKKIKQKIENWIGLITDVFVTKYSISLIYVDDINLFVGDIIYIRSMNNGIIDLKNVRIVIISVKYEKTNVRIEGYGI